MNAENSVGAQLRQIAENLGFKRIDYLTTQEVAQILRVHVQAIRNLCNTGLLVCDRIGTGRTAIRIPFSGLIEYVESARFQDKTTNSNTAAKDRDGLNNTKIRNLKTQPARVNQAAIIRMAKP